MARPVPILKKAGQLGKAATLVFGAPGSGKSSLVRDTIGSGKTVLWVAFNHTAALTGELVADWDVIVPDDWASFDEGVLKPAKANTLKYDALVLDGLNVMAAFRLSVVAPSGSPTQAEWLKMSESLRDSFIALRDKFPEVYAIVDVLPNKEGTREIDLNRHSTNLLTPLFGNKLYTHTVPVRAANGNPSGDIAYKVQRNPLLALELRPVRD